MEKIYSSAVQSEEREEHRNRAGRATFPIQNTKCSAGIPAEHGVTIQAIARMNLIEVVGEAEFDGRSFQS